VGIGPAALSLYVDLAEHDLLHVGSICELGSQDLVPEGFDIYRIARLLWGLGHEFRPLPSGSSRALMEALGFYYDCIDKDGRHGALTLDLNSAIAADVGLEFDLVTNHGTTEHVFDQANCFRLMHYLTRPGGLMIHIVPRRGLYQGGSECGYGAHGLYLYATGFFADLAHANGYEVVRDYEWSDNAGGLSVAVLRRMTSAPFRVPLQAMYR